MEGDVRWHLGRTLAAGQVAEFKVWAELVRQSLGRLHVFLPVRDVGIDGVVHRLADGAYFALQVKGRTELTVAGQVHITVTASSFGDDDALLVAVLAQGDQLGSMALIASESTFRELAVHNIVDGREYLTAAFELHAGGSSRWAPYLVQRERLAERFGVGVAEATAGQPEAPVQVDRGLEGFLGEIEVVRRLAEAATLNIFRPFPDLETVEVLVRHMASHRFLGLQVKTVGWDRAHLENRIYVRRSSFRASPSTFVSVLGWNRDAGRFENDLLLIPSEDVPRIARVEGEWMMLELEPGGVKHRRLEAYRTSLPAFGKTVESMLISPG
ncbi:MAG TPA: hypothetical protein VGJ79_02635 [Candidatus Dormibacteraeota bacterium]